MLDMLSTFLVFVQERIIERCEILLCGDDVGARLEDFCGLWVRRITFGVNYVSLAMGMCGVRGNKTYEPVATAQDPHGGQGSLRQRFGSHEGTSRPKGTSLEGKWISILDCVACTRLMHLLRRMNSSNPIF